MKMMMLIELLQSVQCTQKFHVYITNAYDQNVPIGSGTRQEMLAEDDKVVCCLTFPVSMVTVAKDGALVVRINSDKYDKPLEELFPPEYVQKWQRRDLYRPFKYSCEMEDFPSGDMDVKPAKHGRWAGSVCTSCGESTSFYEDCEYCPKCGSKNEIW